jgi:DNA-binding transcriptional LysR family regulator
VVRAGHPLLQVAAPTAEQIFNYPIISTSRVPPRVLSPLQQQRAAVNGTKANGNRPIPFPAVVCEQVSLMRQIAAHSDAIGIFILPSIRAELAAGTLVPLAYDVDWLGTEFGIIQLRNRPLSPVGDSLVKFLRQQAAELSAAEAEIAKLHTPWRRPTAKELD